ncbi:MAG: endolytic transglycosylase MltG [Deltaproteobacteria bacterium]|jgi:UPF0755 protein|nr:endolytic transglycosylase MltG [Deltaproteobacteria bacterium]
MKLRTKKKLALAFTIMGVAVLAFASYKVYRIITAYPYTTTTISENKKIELEIPRGTTFNEIMVMLKEQKLIKTPLFFRLYTMFVYGDVNIQTGRYQLRSNMNKKQILKTLLAGPIIKLVKVTVPEGKHMLQTAEILAKKGLVKKEEFLKKIKDPALIKSLGLDAPNLEGYLFPETYKFRQGVTTEKVIKTMVKAYQKTWNRLKHKYFKSFRRLQANFKFNSRDIVIMASLIEKETGVSKERPLIASVFLNRLSFDWFKPKLLQTDPTIIYGCTVPSNKSQACSKFKGRIRRIHLRDPDNPYNTYTHAGLPPGPICSPGKAALRSVLQPAQTKFLYFVAKTPGGEHYFSKSRQEHEKAVKKYILTQ